MMSRTNLASELPNLRSCHLSFIHYMANFGRQNKNNPLAIANEPGLTGVEGKEIIEQQTYAPTPITHRLDDLGGITLGEWLKQQMSLQMWLSSANAKNLPRYMLAILLENNDEKVALVNEAICQLTAYSMKKVVTNRDTTTLPFGSFRSLLGFNTGYFDTEYDNFTITDWTRLYYLAQRNPNLHLSEAAKTHIRENFLKFEGPNYLGAIPNTNNSLFRFAAHRVGYPITDDGIQNSENHLLMINGSAYLKNQLANPELNLGTQLVDGLSKHLEKLYDSGLTEFNSIPYAGYTIDALLNLHDFAEEPIKGLATRVLDKIAYEYVIHSTHDGKHFRPFARQSKKVKEQDYILFDTVRPFMMTWLGAELSFYRQQNKSRNSYFVLTALTTSYRPPSYVYELSNNRAQGYLALTAQPHGNAEISYKNGFHEELANGEKKPRQYLLSGGGVHAHVFLAANLWTTSGLNMSDKKSVNDAQICLQRYAAEVVTHNPCLIIDGKEGTLSLQDSFFLGSDKAISKGPGIESRGKNNSGIYFDTLVGSYSVHVPKKYRSKAISPGIKSDWKLYEVEDGLSVAVFDGYIPSPNSGLFFASTTKLGVIMVLPGVLGDKQKLINQIAHENTPSLIAALGLGIKVIKFPEDCQSVIQGKRVYFDEQAPLDRWVIIGCEDYKFSDTDRIFYSFANNGIRTIKGWHDSVTQEKPGAAINNPHYQFLNGKPQNNEFFLQKQSVWNRRGLQIAFASSLVVEGLFALTAVQATSLSWPVLAFIALFLAVVAIYISHLFEPLTYQAQYNHLVSI